MTKKISGDPVLLELMYSMRADMKALFGAKYRQMMPDFIEQIKMEQKRNDCVAAKAAMYVVAKLKMRFKNPGTAQGLAVSALLEGLETDSFSE